MRIYIDHFVTEDEIAKILLNRLRSISNDVTVTSMIDIRDKPEAEIERLDIEEVNKADIIIPIITADYLSHNTPAIDEELDKLSDLDDKTIFPLIYEKANWSSKEYIVKSKIFPSSGEALSELSKKQQSIVINDLVQIVSNIIAKVNKPDIKKEFIVPENKDLSEQIFISHSHTDADFAELLQLHLEKVGIKCWRDDLRLKIGQDWREEIDSGISKSRAIIVIMSPEARKSEYVTYEWAYAWGKEVKILPIMLIQTALHPRLESLQYLDFTNRVTRPYDKLIERIKEI